VFRNYNLFCSNFFSMKTLRTIHEFCMVNLSYHNEYVKKFSLRSWVTEATKVPYFSSFFISCQVWPKISHKPFDILQ